MLHRLIGNMIIQEIDQLPDKKAGYNVIYHDLGSITY